MVQQCSAAKKPAMMGISRDLGRISPMAGPSWQLLHCAVHGPNGWNQVPVEGHRQAVRSQTLATPRSACASSAMKTREVLVSLGKAQQPLDASDFWGQHSTNKSLGVRKVASRAKRTMEPNRLNGLNVSHVSVSFQQKGSRTHCRLHAASSCGIHLAVPIQHG